MTITPITETHPACLGVTCDEHAKCQRYHDVEKVGSENAVGNCFEHGAERPWFVPIKPAAEAA